MENREEKIKVSPLLEIIYDLYREDIRGGKLRVDLFGDCGKVVGKSATHSQTFQQPELSFKE